MADIERVDVAALDLMDPASIDAFAAAHLDAARPLHVLVANAGIMSQDLVRDARGYESLFATNHLGHFQLTNALLPALRAADGARVVSVSSGGHRLSDIRWDDPHFETGYDGMLAYGQSKTANILFAVELDRRWAADGIRGYALHPGQIVTTNLAPWLGDARREIGLIDDAGAPVIDPSRDQKTPQQGASTSVFAAAGPMLDGIGGVFLMDNDIAPLDDPAAVVHQGIGPTTGVMPHAVDPVSARRLWDLSERLLAG
ncbi:SDR family NAD(P)-dependent oxidoreductase [Pseudonocardia sediminis]|uniref:SDR family NAD(P)-dependent oxidoreductase n=1 Tax=Pseudonocardia sediminis TaxID=1397368 RepID=UPI0026D9AAE1